MNLQPIPTMKTTDLPLYHQPLGPWIMQVPVISTQHLPREEGEALLALDPQDIDDSGPDDPPILAHIADGVGHLFMLEDLDAQDMPDFPHLRRVLLAIKARGYGYARVDAQGEVFEDLPQFDW